VSPAGDVDVMFVFKKTCGLWPAAEPSGSTTVMQTLAVTLATGFQFPSKTYSAMAVSIVAAMPAITRVDGRLR
jgi:hypothetical protein